MTTEVAVSQPINAQQIQALMGPLGRNRVKTRKQGGATLSYLEAWDVRAALIRVFGFGNFSVDLIKSKTLHKERVPVLRDGVETGQFHWLIAKEATVRLTIHATGATYTECAIASQKGPDVGEVGDFAMKTAESDALKRAATNLGTQFGLSLYDNGSFVDCVRVVLEPGQAALIAGNVKASAAKTTTKPTAQENAAEAPTEKEESNNVEGGGAQ